MSKVIETISISKSASDVFAFAINPNNTPKWVSGVITEETNESPTRLGTIYRNQSSDGTWAEFEITAFEEGAMFEMTKKDDAHHVRYTLTPVGDTACELEYCVWVEDGAVSERFSPEVIRTILDEFKRVVESE